MFGITDYSKAIVDFANFDVSQLSSALVFGGAILLIGMLTIFAVLCLLWLCLILFKLFFHDMPMKSSAKKPAKDVEVATAEQSAPISAESEVVAVIAAAVAMAEAESDGLKFRVVSFKRI